MLDREWCAVFYIQDTQSQFTVQIFLVSRMQNSPRPMKHSKIRVPPHVTVTAESHS